MLPIQIRKAFLFYLTFSKNTHKSNTFIYIWEIFAQNKLKI